MSKSDVQGTGFREHDPRINYFVKGAPTQNFGDYLPEILAKEFMLHPRIEADIYRLIGSIIDTTWVLRDLRHTIGVQSGHVAFWCCGMRTNAPLDPKVQAMCSFFGVRGALTRDLLKLSEYENRSVCIPHIHDTKPDAELLKISGSCATTRDFRDRAGATAKARQDRECIVRANWRVARLIACAYGRPFAFWDNGHVDIPFKWWDFASSVNILCVFVRNVNEGRRSYRDAITPRMRIPSLSPILEACPLFY